ncbi:MAG: class I tRNA ligase family protein [Actinobacteria bacterium]|nr:class I tRNA ligase family protein [Actinomycetota bacterium]
MDGLRDWNISRQLWWGHRIPVWYCDNGHEFASREDPSVCRECGSASLEQDPDVLDTWFSSQLWPFSTLGWPDDTEDLRTFYPTSVLVTGYEILYLWVARMVMSGMYLAGDTPFRHTMIHGLIRDDRGRKMSKSLGNVIDPLDTIETYGADALRFALLRLATGGQDIPLSVDAIEAGRNFANKLWNVGRLVLRAGGSPQRPPGERPLIERWILSRHERCRAEVDAALEEYRFADAAIALQRFLWSELADWGLEMEKQRLADQEEASEAANLLAWVLERTLRLLHPIMPFVTEELWQQLGAGESIVIAEWPEPYEADADEDLDRDLDAFRTTVTEVRSLSPSIRAGNAYRFRPGARAEGILRVLAHDFQTLTGFSIHLPSSESEEIEVRPPEGGATDEAPQAELDRLAKRVKELRVRQTQYESKLANPGFTQKAPPEAIEKARDNAAKARDEADRLSAQLERLTPSSG